MTTRRHTRVEASPFAVLAKSFALLGERRDPLALDGRPIAGLPDRPIPLVELKARLLHPSTRYTTRDAAIAALLARAKTEGGCWTVGLAGVLLPGLRRAALALVRSCPERAGDVEADMLAGLVAAIDRAEPSRARPAGFLTGRAFDAAKQGLRCELAERGRPAQSAQAACEPPRVFAHPDFVLAEAVAERVISPGDARLIAVTRLEGRDLAAVARASGISYESARQRRSRAERDLVAYLSDGFVTKRGSAAGSRGAGRSRQGRRGARRPGLCPTPQGQPPIRR